MKVVVWTLDAWEPFGSGRDGGFPEKGVLVPTANELRPQDCTPQVSGVVLPPSWG